MEKRQKVKIAFSTGFAVVVTEVSGPRGGGGGPPQLLPQEPTLSA